MPTTEQLIPPMAIGAGRRRRRGVGRLVLLVIVAIVGGAGYYGYTTLMTNSGQPSCRAKALGHDVSFSPEQTANAATITAIALKRGLPARAATIANATAIQESRLGDRKADPGPRLRDQQVLRRPDQDRRISGHGDHQSGPAGPAQRHAPGLRQP